MYLKLYTKKHIANQGTELPQIVRKVKKRYVGNMKFYAERRTVSGTAHRNGACLNVGKISIMIVDRIDNMEYNFYK